MLALNFEYLRYYSGEKPVPMLTIVIGGNHEASNYFQELPYGGWIAPNIYYLGYAGVVSYNGFRIAGISGIYKRYDYFKGHFEFPPYNNSTLRSVYHYRYQEVFRLKLLQGPIDFMLSHDWPTRICKYGNVEQLLIDNPHLSEDVSTNTLGSGPLFELLNQMKPRHWLSAHLHVKFAATFPHATGEKTEFLALDKCLPDRQYLQIMDVESRNDSKLNDGKLKYDFEWINILYQTKRLNFITPIAESNSIRFGFPNEDKTENTELIWDRFGQDLFIPLNFSRDAVPHKLTDSPTSAQQTDPVQNQQTVKFCNNIGIRDPLELLGCFHQ